MLIEKIIQLNFRPNDEFYWAKTILQKIRKIVLSKRKIAFEKEKREYIFHLPES